MNRPGTPFIVALALLASATAARSELRCDEPQVQLGEVKAGQPLSHRFSLTNHGHDVVEVTLVQPGCGCLKPRLAERRLRPGATGVLVLEVNTLTTPAGPNAWRVQVFYTAGGRPHDLTLTLHATVVTEITVQPAALVLHTGTTLGHEVVVTDGRAAPLSVSQVRTTTPMLRAVPRDCGRDEAGRKVVAVRVDVLPGFPPGRHDETLQIFTPDPAYPELRVPVTVVKQLQATVSAAPAEVTLTAGAGPLPARVVLLRGAGGQDVAIERAECDDPAVRCTWAKGPGEMATLRVQVDRAGVSAGGLHAAVRVRLSSPAGSEVTVPVHCAAR
jgi:hypothetical protein